MGEIKKERRREEFGELRWRTNVTPNSEISTALLSTRQITFAYVTPYGRSHFNTLEESRIVDGKYEHTNERH